MSDSPLVSLIVVNYNGAALLPAFFAALATTDYTPYEVIVVDNASSDASLAYLATEQPQVTVVASTANLGFGGACNRGAQAAGGDLLVFLNPDVHVTRDWLRLLIEHLRERPEAAIICPTTLFPGDRPVPSAAATAEAATVPGCAMMVTRRAWRELGGFDEKMFLYWEDTEICWRAWLLGWSVLSDLQAYVYHERGGITGGRRWDAEQTKNSLYTYLKLMRWRRVIPFAIALAAKTLIKLVIYRQPSLLGAWGWNLRHLPHILAARRCIQQQRRIEPQQLERMVDLHDRKQAYYRRLRKRS